MIPHDSLSHTQKTKNKRTCLTRCNNELHFPTINRITMLSHNDPKNYIFTYMTRGTMFSHIWSEELHFHAVKQGTMFPHDYPDKYVCLRTRTCAQRITQVRVLLPVTGASMSIIVFSCRNNAAPSFMSFNATPSSSLPSSIKCCFITSIFGLPLESNISDVLSLWAGGKGTPETDRSS